MGMEDLGMKLDEGDLVVWCHGGDGKVSLSIHT